MISNLQCIFINAINNEKRKIPEELLFFPFCPLSRKEKEIETQRPLRLERAKRAPLERDLRYATMRGKKHID